MLELWPGRGENEITLTRYIRNDDRVARPAMLVVPGGGYSSVCRFTEGVPIAERFASLGFQAFILHYHVAPNRFPKPQEDILRAIKLIRANAAAWNVIPDNIAAVGFSAGGHLCASAGIFYNEVEANAGDAADKVSGRPDATLLCYPVITFVGKGHFGSGHNLLGDEFEANRTRFSLETRITPDTPPAFLWHTVADQVVPYENSTMYAEALRQNGVPCEEHIYPHGRHGMQLGYGVDNLSHWPEEAKRFLVEAANFHFPSKHIRKTVILTFDDASKSHITVAAPTLLKYGFGATFFITNFQDEFHQQHASEFLSTEDIIALDRMGFEIGNHTWSHPKLEGMSADDISEEIGKLNRFLIETGVKLPVSFAYPGGPYQGDTAANAVLCHAQKYARTTEQRPWNPALDNNMRIPAIPIQGNDTASFRAAVDQATAECPVVIVFHGVPDTVHAHVNTPAAVFEEDMQYLHDNGFDVCALRDFEEK